MGWSLGFFAVILRYLRIYQRYKIRAAFAEIEPRGSLTLVLPPVSAECAGCPAKVPAGERDHLM